MTRTSRLVVAALSFAALAVAGCGAFPDTGASALGLRGFGAGKGELMGFKDGHKMMGGHGMVGGHGMRGGRGMKGGHGMIGGRGFKGGPGGLGGFGLPGLHLAGLELTEAQRTSLKAIMEKYKPAEAKPDPAAMAAKRAAAKAKHEALKAALVAEPFDAAALRAALAPAADAPAKPGLDPALLTEVRALLTDDQRAAAIARLKEAAARPAREKPADAGKPDHAARLAAILTLTDDQQAKLAALSAAHEAARPDLDPATRHAAAIAFLETGDTAGLTAARTHPAPPIDAIVDFVGSLDAAQRAKLGDLGMLLGKGGHGMKAGPGMAGGHKAPFR